MVVKQLYPCSSTTCHSPEVVCVRYAPHWCLTSSTSRSRVCNSMTAQSSSNNSGLCLFEYYSRTTFISCIGNDSSKAAVRYHFITSSRVASYVLAEDLPMLMFFPTCNTRCHFQVISGTPSGPMFSEKPCCAFLILS